MSFVLGSLMVAEERITTKFSGLVGADGSEEEVTFLATQQVDEARHMQFYARFQDEVVSEPALIAAHVAARPRAGLARLRTIFDEKLVAAHERLVANPGDVAAKVAFVTIYHLVLEATLGPDDVRVLDALHGARGSCSGFVAGYTKIHHDEHRHIGYGIWYLRQAVAEDPAMGDVVREHPARSAAGGRRVPDAAGRGRRLGPGRLGRGAARLRPRRPDAQAQHHRRAARHALSV